MDELPEFRHSTIEILRQPLEDKRIHIARTYGSFVYPADFMLVAAMNPCPCGHFPDRNRCRCSESEIKKYLSRISGPTSLFSFIIPLKITNSNIYDHSFYNRLPH